MPEKIASEWHQGQVQGGFARTSMNDERSRSGKALARHGNLIQAILQLAVFAGQISH